MTRRLVPLSKHEARKAKVALGKKRRQMLQERSWAKKSGEVRTGRIEDLPDDHPAKSLRRFAPRQEERA
jgi:hypothetical protein